MPHYLANIDPAKQWKRLPETHDDIAFRVYAASILSGQNVKYLTCSTPNHWTSKSSDCNHYGCIVGFEDTFDYSKFWQEFDKLEITSKQQ